MKPVLIAWFLFVIVVPGWITTVASLERGVFDAGGELWRDHLWFRATLLDAYFAFAAVALWVVWREPRWTTRVLWLVAIAGLGNFAISAYVVAALVRWQPRDGVAALLIGPYRREASA